MMDVPEHQFVIQQLDLFHALSLSVKSKRVSLKWCEYSMDFPNIEDMPEVKNGDDFLDAVLYYNKNDVLATKALYRNYYYEIELRIMVRTPLLVNVLDKIHFVLLNLDNTIVHPQF